MLFLLLLLLIVGVVGAMIVLATQVFFRIQDALIDRAIETFESGGVGEKNKMDSSV